MISAIRVKQQKKRSILIVFSIIVEKLAWNKVLFIYTQYLKED
jgi:hypothetical protein